MRPTERLGQAADGAEHNAWVVAAATVSARTLSRETAPC